MFRVPVFIRNAPNLDAANSPRWFDGIENTDDVFLDVIGCNVPDRFIEMIGEIHQIGHSVKIVLHGLGGETFRPANVNRTKRSNATFRRDSSRGTGLNSIGVGKQEDFLNRFVHQKTLR